MKQLQSLQETLLRHSTSKNNSQNQSDKSSSLISPLNLGIRLSFIECVEDIKKTINNFKRLPRRSYSIDSSIEYDEFFDNFERPARSVFIDNSDNNYDYLLQSTESNSDCSSIDSGFFDSISSTIAKKKLSIDSVITDQNHKKKINYKCCLTEKMELGDGFRKKMTAIHKFLCLKEIQEKLEPCLVQNGIKLNTLYSSYQRLSLQIKEISNKTTYIKECEWREKALKIIILNQDISKILSEIIAGINSYPLIQKMNKLLKPLALKQSETRFLLLSKDLKKSEERERQEKEKLLQTITQSFPSVGLQFLTRRSLLENKLKENAPSSNLAEKHRYQCEEYEATSDELNAIMGFVKSLENSEVDFLKESALESNLKAVNSKKNNPSIEQKPQLTRSPSDTFNKSIVYDLRNGKSFNAIGELWAQKYRLSGKELVRLDAKKIRDNLIEHKVSQFNFNCKENEKLKKFALDIKKTIEDLLFENNENRNCVDELKKLANKFFIGEKSVIKRLEMLGNLKDLDCKRRLQQEIKNDLKDCLESPVVRKNSLFKSLFILLLKIKNYFRDNENEKKILEDDKRKQKFRKTITQFFKQTQSKKINQCTNDLDAQCVNNIAVLVT